MISTEREPLGCGYMWLYVSMETGIRELKDNLSRYIRRIEAGWLPRDEFARDSVGIVDSNCT